MKQTHTIIIAAATSSILTAIAFSSLISDLALAAPSGVAPPTPPTIEQAPNERKLTVTGGGKLSFYEVVNPFSIGAGGLVSGQAKCNDNDDIPVSGACYGVAGTELRGNRHIDWTTWLRPAAFDCAYSNPTSTSLMADARIVCQRYSPK